MDLGALFPFALALLLHVVRVGAFVAVVPIFGRQHDSMILRVVLSLTLGAIFWWVGTRAIAVPGSLLELGVMAVREVVVGFALGFSIAAIVSLLVMAGEVISMEMGFSMARAMDPETGTSTTVVSQLLHVVGMLLVLALDLHHDALRLVQQTFEACPVGEAFAFAPIWEGIKALVGAAVELALQFTMPVIGIMLLMSTGTVLIGRAVPTINMMEFAFGLRVLMALGVLAFYMAEAMPFVVACFEGMFGRVAEMFGG